MYRQQSELHEVKSSGESTSRRPNPQETSTPVNQNTVEAHDAVKRRHLEYLQSQGTLRLEMPMADPSVFENMQNPEAEREQFIQTMQQKGNISPAQAQQQLLQAVHQSERHNLELIRQQQQIQAYQHGQQAVEMARQQQMQARLQHGIPNVELSIQPSPKGRQQTANLQTFPESSPIDPKLLLHQNGPRSAAQHQQQVMRNHQFGVDPRVDSSFHSSPKQGNPKSNLDQHLLLQGKQTQTKYQQQQQAQLHELGYRGIETQRGQMRPIFQRQSTPSQHQSPISPGLQREVSPRPRNVQFGMHPPIARWNGQSSNMSLPSSGLKHQRQIGVHSQPHENMFQSHFQNNNFDVGGHHLLKLPASQSFQGVQCSLDQNTKDAQFPPDILAGTPKPQTNHSFYTEAPQSSSGYHFMESNAQSQGNVSERKVFLASMLGPHGQHSYHQPVSSFPIPAPILLSSTMPAPITVSNKPKDTLSSFELLAQHELEIGVDSPMEGQERETLKKPAKSKKKPRQKKGPLSKKRATKKNKTRSIRDNNLTVASPMATNSNFSSEVSISPSSPCPESKTDNQKVPQQAHNPGMSKNDERVSAAASVNGRFDVEQQIEDRKKQAVEIFQQDILQGLLAEYIARNETSEIISRIQGCNEASKTGVTNGQLSLTDAMKESTQPQTFPGKYNATADGNDEASLQPKFDFYRSDVQRAVEPLMHERDRENDEHADALREIMALVELPDDTNFLQEALWDGVDGQVAHGLVTDGAGAQVISGIMVSLDFENGIPPPPVEFANAWSDGLQIPGELGADVWNKYGSIDPYTWSLDELVDTSSGLRTPGRLD
jgi:hypothetical protein